jgi:hypothetical protein
MPGMLKCALRTLYEEIAKFRFEYPLMTLPEASPKESLHYYLYRDFGSQLHRLQPSCSHQPRVVLRVVRRGRLSASAGISPEDASPLSFPSFGRFRESGVRV